MELTPPEKSPFRASRRTALTAAAGAFASSALLPFVLGSGPIRATLIATLGLIVIGALWAAFRGTALTQTVERVLAIGASLVGFYAVFIAAPYAPDKPAHDSVVPSPIDVPAMWPKDDRLAYAANLTRRLGFSRFSVPAFEGDLILARVRLRPRTEPTTYRIIARPAGGTLTYNELWVWAEGGLLDQESANLRIEIPPSLRVAYVPGSTLLRDRFGNMGRPLSDAIFSKGVVAGPVRGEPMYLDFRLRVYATQPVDKSFLIGGPAGECHEDARNLVTASQSGLTCRVPIENSGPRPLDDVAVRLKLFGGAEPGVSVVTSVMAPAAVPKEAMIQTGTFLLPNRVGLARFAQRSAYLRDARGRRIAHLADAIFARHVSIGRLEPGSSAAREIEFRIVASPISGPK